MIAHNLARFLLARLHVDTLLDKRTKAKVHATLEKLTGGSHALDEAYRDAMRRIEAQMPDDSALAKRALSWITYAERQLTIKEICHALAVEEGDEELQFDNVLDVDEIVSLCAGLVIVDSESEIIRLVHYTTQEYFERARENWNPSAQQEIASTCLTYLAFQNFSSRMCSSHSDLYDRLKQYPLYYYAARYWGNHARGVQEQVAEVAYRFLRSHTLLSPAAQLMSSSYFHEFSDQPGYTTALHITARFGLVHLSAMWLTPSADNGGTANLKDISGRTPLSIAADQGHEEVVKLLLARNDVEVDSMDGDSCTPLSNAADQGHEEVVKLLLTRNDVEAGLKDNAGRTPLSKAAYGGHEEVVKLLLTRDDVEADSKDNDSWTPLSYAAYKGHEEVVKLLLTRDDVEAGSKDNAGCTPLSKAADQGHKEVVKLLLTRDDVEADSKDNDSWTPLSYAAHKGHEEVVKLLLTRDDVEAGSKDNAGCTPLSKAADQGHKEVVKLLLTRDDVEADSKDNDSWTPLSYAAYKGHEEVVKLLLTRDDVEAGSTTYTARRRSGLEGQR